MRIILDGTAVRVWLDRKATSVSWLVIIGVRASSTHKLSPICCARWVCSKVAARNISRLHRNKDVILGEDGYPNRCYNAPRNIFSLTGS